MAKSAVQTVFEEVRVLLRRKDYSTALALLEGLCVDSLTESQRAEFSVWLARAEFCAGKHPLKRIDEAIELLRFSSAHELFAEAKLLKGQILASTGELEDAREALLESYVSFVRCNEAASAARALNRLAYVAYLQGNVLSAIENQRMCVAAYLKIDDSQNYHLTVANLSSLLLMAGHISESIDLFRKIGVSPLPSDFKFCANLYTMSALPHALRGDIATARKTIAKAEPYLDQHIREKAIYFENLGLINILDDDYDAAEKALTAGLEISMKIAPESALVSQIKRLFADLYVATEQWDKAETFAKEALAVAEKIQERVEIAACRRAQAQIAAHKGDTAKAADLYTKAIDLFNQISTRYELAVCRLRAGGSGLFDRARSGAMLYLAREYFVSEKVTHLVDEIDELLSAPTAVPRPDTSGAPVIVTVNEEMRNILRLAESVAPSDMTVLLTGETGTGKDLLASYIHAVSGRKGEFVAVNMAAIPNDMAEAELFGHKKGSFTGTTGDRAGLIEQADKGTLYLNEIADASAAVQAKLLEVLETHKVRRLGENRTRPVAFRLIAATNRDLGELARKGGFRLDLFHRLNEIPVQLPPLSKRGEDIPHLLRYFLEEQGWHSRNGAPLELLELARLLQEREWPGNVRELRSTIRRLWMLSGGNLRTFRCQLESGGILPPSERDQLIEALEQTDGNQSETARSLGVCESTVRHRIRKYKL